MEYIFQQDIDENLKSLISLLALCKIAYLNDETGRIYGKLKTELPRKARPIPENDLWIAALSIQHSFRLITEDKHFEFIDNLNYENWLD